MERWKKKTNFDRHQATLFAVTIPSTQNFRALHVRQSYSQYHCPGRQNLRWPQMEDLRQWDLEGSCQSKFGHWLISQLKWLGSNSLGAAIQGHLKFWNLSQVCWWCLIQESFILNINPGANCFFLEVSLVNEHLSRNKKLFQWWLDYLSPELVCAKICRFHWGIVRKPLDHIQGLILIHLLNFTKSIKGRIVF